MLLHNASVSYKSLLIVNTAFAKACQVVLCNYNGLVVKLETNVLYCSPQVYKQHLK